MRALTRVMIRFGSGTVIEFTMVLKKPRFTVQLLGGFGHRLNLKLCAKQRAIFLGENDFNAFRSVHCDAEHAFREMFSVTIERTERPPVGHFIDIVFHANAFCRHMCRILAGTLAEVGMGKFVPDDIPAIMASRDRRRGGRTAPPGGLTLLEVAYPSQG